MTLRFLVGADVPPDPDSGAAGTVFQTNAALRALGCDVDAIWTADLGRRIRHGNLHYALELPRAYRREVARRLSVQRYDVVMLSQPHAYLAGEYIKRHHPGVLFYNRTHGWEGQYEEAVRMHLRGEPGDYALRKLLRGGMRRVLERHQHRVIQVADTIVSGSSEVAGYLYRNYGYPQDRVAVLPHGVPDVFVATPPAPDDARWRKVLYVGQFAPFKAPQVAAEVFNRLLDGHPDVQGGWVCDTRDHARVRAMLSPRIQSRMTLYPWMSQDALIKVYDEHGIFVFTSFYEGFGKTPFEAMARGLAVVSTRVGGMADIIRPGESGFLVAPADAGAMVNIAGNLLADTDLARTTGLRARAVASTLTWKNHAQGLLAWVERRKHGQA